MGRMVKCAFCQNLVDKDGSVRYNDKNYHSHCHKALLERKEVYKYVARLFGFKNEDKPGPVINSQLKNFIEKYNYTYTGMLNALKYFYEIKGGSKDKANQGIGIVPYIYDEAQEYYAKMASKQEKVAQTIEKQLKEAPKVLKVKKVEDKKIVGLYNFEEL
jgi:hypothetical protein